MRDGVEGDRATMRVPLDHISGAAMDRTEVPVSDAALTDYMRLAQPLWESVRDRLSECRRARRETDPEVIHALRVSLRRLKALQWAYRPSIEDPILAPERDMTRTLLHAAGSVRDWDVALTLAEDWLPRFKKTQSVLSAVRADAATFGVRRLTEHADHVGALSSATVRHAPLSEAGSGSGPAPVDLAFLAARLKAARKQMRKRGQRAAHRGADPYTALHAVRKAGKRVRDVHALIVGFAQTQLTLVEAMPDSAPAVDASTAAMPETAARSKAANDLKGREKRARKQARKQTRWAKRLLDKKQRKRLGRVQSRFGALNDVVHSADLMRATAERSRRFAQASGIKRLIRTLDQVADGYRREAVALL